MTFHTRHAATYQRRVPALREPWKDYVLEGQNGWSRTDALRVNAALNLLASALPSDHQVIWALERTAIKSSTLLDSQAPLKGPAWFYKGDIYCLPESLSQLLLLAEALGHEAIHSFNNHEPSSLPPTTSVDRYKINAGWEVEVYTSCQVVNQLLGDYFRLLAGEDDSLDQQSVDAWLAEMQYYQTNSSWRLEWYLLQLDVVRIIESLCELVVMDGDVSNRDESRFAILARLLGERCLRQWSPNDHFQGGLQQAFVQVQAWALPQELNQTQAIQQALSSCSERIERIRGFRDLMKTQMEEFDPLQ